MLVDKGKAIGAKCRRTVLTDLSVSPRTTTPAAMPVDSLFVPDEPRWFALRALPSHERCVELMLSAKGVPYYCPRYQHTTRGTRPLTSHLPLFPGYVMAHFEWDARRYVTNIMGLQRTPILQFGMTPAIITNLEIEQIRIMQANNAVPWDRPIAEGDRVNIRGGAFNGMDGVVAQAGDKTFFVVNVVFFNRPIAAHIDRNLLELAAA